MKRSAEQALRDELETAKHEEAIARAKADLRRERVKKAMAAMGEANTALAAAAARIDRATRALEVLIPLPIASESDPTATWHEDWNTPVGASPAGAPDAKE